MVGGGDYAHEASKCQPAGHSGDTWLWKCGFVGTEGVAKHQAMRGGLAFNISGG